MTKEKANRIWGDADPVPPWEWRKGAKNSGYVKGTAEGYHGNTKSHVFHSINCRHYSCKNCTVEFRSAKQATSTG